MSVRLLLVALLLACLPIAGSAPQTSVTVSVKNQYDKPVDNAAVILDFLGSHQMIKLGKRKATHWEVHTNLQGIATFPPIPPGTIQLQVIKMPQYQTFGEKFDIDPGERKIEVKLNPPQKQYSAHPPLKPAEPPKQ